MGIFRITARKKMGQNPSIPSGASVPSSHPTKQRVDVLLRQPDGWVRRHQKRGSRPLLGPGVAGLIQTVVYPGEGAIAGVAIDRLHLPVGGAEAGVAVEGQEGKVSGELEDRR